MSLLKGIDIGNKNPDAIDAAGGNEGLLPDGVYHAELVKAKKLEGNGSEGFETTFEVVAPPMFAGMTVKDSVWEPKAGNAKQETRVLMLYHRLGLLKKTEDAKGVKSYTPVEGLNDIPDVLNNRYFINVVTREFTAKEGGQIKVNGLAFEAIVQPNDERAKKLGPVAAAPAGAGGAKKPDYGDL